MRKYLSAFIVAVGLLVAIPVLAVNVTIPQSTGYGVVPIGNASGGNYSIVATSSLGLPTWGFPFTVTGYGVSTSTIVGFVQGFLSSASSTIATLHLGTPLETTSGGTGLSSYTLGDTIYASGANTLSKLSGNITTAQLFLAQTGDGVNSAAPSWQPIPVAGSKAYYAYGTQATSSAAYYNMNPVATTTSTTQAYAMTTSPQTLQNWISPVGDPGVATIPGGTYIVDLFAWRSSGSAAVTLAVQVWEVSSTGADISLIGTTNSTAALGASKAQYNLAFTTSAHAMASTGSRIVMRVIATSAGTPTVSMSFGDGDQMDLVTPGVTVTTSTFVPYTGAVQNLNLGTNGFNAFASSTIGDGSVTGGLTINGTATTTNFINSNVTSALALFDAFHKEGAYAGTSCTNQFVRSLSATGSATCATVANTDLANSSLTVTAGTGLGGGGSVSLGGSVTLFNTQGYPFTTTTNFGQTVSATTTAIWAQATPISLMASSTFAFVNATSTGEVQGTDTVNAFTGVISPTHRFALSTGTTTSWTASTTGTAYSPYLVMPFSGTLKQVYCATDQSFLGVNIQVNGSNATPSYFVSSTTVGIVPFTSGNTFTRGQKVLANFGTTTTASTLQDSCTFDATETP